MKTYMLDSADNMTPLHACILALRGWRCVYDRYPKFVGCLPDEWTPLSALRAAIKSCGIETTDDALERWLEEDECDRAKEREEGATASAMRQMAEIRAASKPKEVKL